MIVVTSLVIQIFTVYYPCSKKVPAANVEKAFARFICASATQARFLL